MFSKLTALLLMLALLCVIGCTAHIHEVGKDAPYPTTTSQHSANGI